MLKTSKLACLAFVLVLAAFAIGVTTGASDASAQDTTRPTVTLTGPATFKDAHVLVRVQFSEEVSGLTAPEQTGESIRHQFTITNGSASLFERLGSGRWSGPKYTGLTGQEV